MGHKIKNPTNATENNIRDYYLVFLDANDPFVGNCSEKPNEFIKDIAEFKKDLVVLNKEPVPSKC